MAKQDEEIRFSLVDGVTKGLGKISDAFKSIEDHGAKLNQNFELVGKGIDKVKQAAEIFAGPVEAAASFEAALAKVAAVTGASAAELAVLKRAAEQASLAFGVPVEEAAAALENLARNGLNAADAANALGPALALSKAGAIDLNTAASLVGDTMDQFGLSASAAAAVADLFAQTAIKSGAGVTGLAEAMAKLAPQARVSGVGIRDAAAALGLLAQGGVESEKAGKALQAVFAALQDPTSKLRQNLRLAGDDSADFATAIDVLSKNGSLADRTFTDLGPKVGPQLAILVRQGATAFNEFRDGLKGADGAAEKLAATTEDTFEGALKRLQQSLAGLQRAVGEPLLKPLTQALNDTVAQLKLFADSPEFEKIRAVVAKAFSEAAVAVREFLRDFDFDAAKAKISEFAANADENFRKIETAVGFAITGIQVLGQTVRLVFDGLDIAVSASVAQTAKALSLFLTPLAKVSDAALETKRVLDKVADESFERVKAAGKGAGEAVSGIGKAMEDAGKKAGDAAPKVDNFAAALAKAEKPPAAADPVAALATQLGLLPKVLDPAAIAAQETAQRLAEMAEMAGKSKDELEATGKAAAVSAEQIAEAQGAVDAARIAYQKLIEAHVQDKDALQAANDAWKEAIQNLEGLKKKAFEASGAAKQLAADFKDLGITSQAELATKASNAALALDRITEAQRNGQAATEDVKRAFEAYADAVRKSVADSEPAIKSQAEAQIAQRAAALGITQALNEMGKAGADANQQIAATGNEAAAALDRVAGSAEGAAKSADDFASSAKAAAKATKDTNSQLTITGSSLVGVSLEFAKAADKLNTLARQPFFIQNFNRLADIFTRQTIELNKQNAELDKQLEKYDELAQRVRELRTQFRTLGEDQLRTLAQKQLQIEQQRKREEEDIARQRAELERQKQEQAAEAVKQQTGATQGAGLTSGPAQVNNFTFYGVVGNTDDVAKTLAPAIQKAIKDRSFLSR